MFQKNSYNKFVCTYYKKYNTTSCFLKETACTSRSSHYRHYSARVLHSFIPIEMNITIHNHSQYIYIFLGLLTNDEVSTIRSVHTQNT